MPTPSQLDGGQIIKRVFDAASDAIRVEISSAITLGAIEIQDGNGGTDKAAVKPASVTPLATDPALVVTISPNSAPSSVTVSNGAGVAAVNIQDGGNSITVDGAVTVSATNLDTRDLVFASDKVDASGSAVTAIVSATDLDIRDLVFASDKVDASGSLINSKPIGYTVSEFIRNDYTSTAVTSGSYVELIASTAAEYQEMELFDSSGYSMIIAFGAMGMEVDQFIDYPGGNGRILHHVPAGTRISIIAADTSATAGEIDLNLRG